MATIFQFPACGPISAVAQNSIEDDWLANLVDCNAQFDYAAKPKRSKPADPIGDVRDVSRFGGRLLEKGKTRDYLLFTVGVGSALRCGDIVSLRVGHLFDVERKEFFEIGELVEQKTGKRRSFEITPAMQEAFQLHYAGTEKLDSNDFLFMSESSNGAKLTSARSHGKGMSVLAVEQMLKKTAAEIGLTCHVSTHTMRKTYAYHFLRLLSMEGKRESLLELQVALNHSDPQTTLAYTGITIEEIRKITRNLPFSKRGYALNAPLITIPEAIPFQAAARG